MSVKAAFWIECPESMLGPIYSEVVRHMGVIDRKTQAGDVCSVLIRVPQETKAAFQEATSKLDGSVFISQA
jgi:hypothetical protein